MRKSKDKYKYLQLILGREKRKAWMEDLAIIRTPQLRSIVNAFALNTARASALSVSLAEIGYQVRRDQWCVDYAVFKIEGIVREPFTVFKPSAAVRDEYSRQIEKLLNLPADERSQLLATWGAGVVENMLRFSPGMDVSVEALLSSIVIESWTAFETLASVLWAKAIDIGPRKLRNRVISKTLRAEKSDEVLDFGDNLEIDPQRRFGSALREARKVSFQRLSFIIRNYEIAFGSRIKTLLKGENNYIAALSAYRNALIHNAGKADAEFVQRIKDFPEFASIKRNQKLNLEGELVARLREAATTVGAKLLHFVDDVLTPNQR